MLLLVEWGSEFESEGNASTEIGPKWLTLNEMNTEHLTNNFQVADVNYNFNEKIKFNYANIRIGLCQAAKEKQQHTAAGPREKRNVKMSQSTLPFGHFGILLLLYIIASKTI